MASFAEVGVSPQMLKIIASFHDDMQAEGKIGGTFSESFEVRNNLCMSRMHSSTHTVYFLF